MTRQQHENFRNGVIVPIAIGCALHAACAAIFVAAFLKLWNWETTKELLAICIAPGLASYICMNIISFFVSRQDIILWTVFSVGLFAGEILGFWMGGVSLSIAGCVSGACLASWIVYPRVTSWAESFIKSNSDDKIRYEVSTSSINIMMLNGLAFCTLGFYFGLIGFWFGLNYFILLLGMGYGAAGIALVASVLCSVSNMANSSLTVAKSLVLAMTWFVILVFMGGSSIGSRGVVLVGVLVNLYIYLSYGLAYILEWRWLKRLTSIIFFTPLGLPLVFAVNNLEKRNFSSSKINAITLISVFVSWLIGGGLGFVSKPLFNL